MMKNFNTIGVHLKLQIPPRPLVHEQKIFFGGGGGRRGAGESPKKGGILDSLQI